MRRVSVSKQGPVLWMYSSFTSAPRLILPIRFSSLGSTRRQWASSTSDIQSRALPPARPLIPKRVAVISKTTRYEDESMRISRKPFELLTESEHKVVSGVLSRQGFSISAIRSSHESQKAAVQMIIDTLRSRDIEVEVVTSGERFTSTYTDEPKQKGGHGDERKTMFLEGGSGISMALLESGKGQNFDFCISGGGDGTFLRASLGITGRIPLVGVNTDPTRSRGRLCVCTATTLGQFLDRLAVGNYEWQKRQRIQLTLRTIGSEKRGRVLRQWALNEVFVGERDPCRASVLRVSSDGAAAERLKCSGLLVSTGTGSSAWTSEAMKITPQEVIDVLGGISEVYGDKGVTADIGQILSSNQGFDAGAVAAATNRQLVAKRLAPEDPRMHLLIREPILSSGDISPGHCVWQGLSARQATIDSSRLSPRHHQSRRSIVKKLIISSVGMDAHLVLDGRVWVPLERGVEAILETSEEHALFSVKAMYDQEEEWGVDDA